jgi:hypothetical protein
MAAALDQATDRVVNTVKGWFSHPDNSGAVGSVPGKVPTNVQTGTPASTSQQGVVNNSAASSNTNQGTIYVVPGKATPSGKDYVGRHNKPNPAKTRRSKDGRDRTQAQVVNTYDSGNTQEGREKEQAEINARGGVQNLDNRRNEIQQQCQTGGTTTCK